jgi:hypothetical protein
MLVEKPATIPQALAALQTLLPPEQLDVVKRSSG